MWSSVWLNFNRVKLQHNIEFIKFFFFCYLMVSVITMCNPINRLIRATFWVLYSTANDHQPQTIPRPQMILDRKWSPKLTANDPVKSWGMEWILWDWLQKRTDYKKGTFFSRLLKKKGRRTLRLRSIYTRPKKSRINLKRIWYQPYTSSMVNCFNFL